MLWNRLPSNATFYWTNNPCCPFCPNCYEDAFHIVFHYVRAKEVWMLLLDLQSLPSFHSGLDWLSYNLAWDHIIWGHLKWIHIFPFLCWFLRKRRNKWVFQRENLKKEECLKQIKAATWEYIAFQPFVSDTLSPTSARDKHWLPPSSQFLTKVNVDAAWDETSLVGMAGVARNNQGLWKGGFMCRCLLAPSAAVAELLAIKCGLQHILSCQWTNAILVSDCKRIVDIINNPHASYEFINVVMDCRVLLGQSSNCVLQFEDKAYNHLADAMTKGARTDMAEVDNLLWFNHPPQAYVNYYMYDKNACSTRLIQRGNPIDNIADVT